jgi:hypothetical protein
MRNLAIAFAGGIAAAALQRFTPTGWWLNTGQGVILTSLVLALLAVAVGVTAVRPMPPRSMLPPIALWAGANMGLAIVLFSTGPGTIFPIVLLFGAGISALAVGAGSLIGQLARAAWARASSPEK